jgi:hypothetical protein
MQQMKKGFQCYLQAIDFSVIDCEALKTSGYYHYLWRTFLITTGQVHGNNLCVVLFLFLVQGLAWKH